MLVEPILPVRLLCKHPSSNSMAMVVVGRFLQPCIILDKLFNGFRDGCDCNKGGDSFSVELLSVAVALLVFLNNLNSWRLSGVW